MTPEEIEENSLGYDIEERQPGERAATKKQRDCILRLEPGFDPDFVGKLGRDQAGELIDQVLEYHSLGYSLGFREEGDRAATKNQRAQIQALEPGFAPAFLEAISQDQAEELLEEILDYMAGQEAEAFAKTGKPDLDPPPRIEGEGRATSDQVEDLEVEEAVLSDFLGSQLSVKTKGLGKLQASRLASRLRAYNKKFYDGEISRPKSRAGGCLAALVVFVSLAGYVSFKAFQT